MTDSLALLWVPPIDHRVLWGVWRSWTEIRRERRARRRFIRRKARWFKRPPRGVEV